MEKKTVLKKYFSKEVKEFREHQEEAIDAVLIGERVLCLMPTGEGKSLIYQVAGLCLEKAVIVISPLIALMKQQKNDLEAKGLKCLFMSELDYKHQFKELTKIAQGAVPDFFFISPERAANDGYFGFVMNLIQDKIGMVVVDEVHCISQWGDGFRPAYKMIPDFMNRVFGVVWPKVLCLTATLNENEQKQIESEFGITKTIKSKNLWRENLKLNFLNLGSGKDDTKEEALKKIMDDHTDEKTLIFVHRKYGRKGTTRTLCESFSKRYKACDFFDADIIDSEKDRILEGFKDGSVKNVFATSAFGMGVDISDIRLVVHYLIPESVEQYYQEVGRAGRDRKTSFGYLLYTKQSRSGRLRLIDGSLCDKESLSEEYKDRILRSGDQFGSVKYEELADKRRVAFALLNEYGVIKILTKGVQSLKCFKSIGIEGDRFLDNIRATSPTLLTKIVCKKQGISINSLISDIWRLCVKGELVLVSAPTKAIFYAIDNELKDKIICDIMKDQLAKREKRRKSFGVFVDAIENEESAETIVKKVLNIM